MAAITENDIIWRMPTVTNRTTANGGRMTKQVMPTPAGVFQPVSKDERTAGGTFYAKRFIHTAITTNTTLANAYVYTGMPTREVDRVSLFLGTQTNTQNDLTGSERKYGCGFLDANVIVGATSVAVAVESAADNTFQVGDTIKIFHKEWDSLNSIWTELTSERVVVTTKSALGDVITLGFATPLQNAFDSIEIWDSGSPAQLIEFTGVASMIPVGNVQAGFSNFVVTSAGGDYDEINYPLTLKGLSTIQQNWTLTFTSTTAFSITGDTLGLLGTGGNISTNTAPINTDYSNSYWTLLSAGFSGSWVIGDTITFTTTPHSIPVWAKQVVPAATPSFTDNRWLFELEAESA